MSHFRKFYIDGAWIDPIGSATLAVVNPATEEAVATISLGTQSDVDRAVAAARAAFVSYSRTTRGDRLALLEQIIKHYQMRYDEIADAITLEMGAPKTFSRDVQTRTGIEHLRQAIEVLKTYQFEWFLGGNLISREAIGVCGLITPWNWPVNQVISKLAYALAAGCTVVLKPSEISPLSTIVLAQVLHDAGVPAGVFNLVNGDGPTVGQAISSHPDIDLVSFTGSTAAGVLVAQAAASSVKRVQQELGGKSPHIVLPDADLEEAVSWGVLRCFTNSGQSCQAPTRMFVHVTQLETATEVAKNTAQGIKIGDPTSTTTTLGPLASKVQYDKVQRLMKAGLAEGATLICGGPGRPANLNRGYYAKPTVFANVRPEMTIAKEEIFGPVLSMFSYDDESEAIRLANDTVYGLAGYIHSKNMQRARQVASRLRAGRIYINGAPSNVVAPFGGYKQSGNGRESGLFGLEEYLEIKAVIGIPTDDKPLAPGHR